MGSNSNIGENGLDLEYRRAVILEVDATTAGSRIYASGIRNPTGLGWNPETGQLWTIANERDEIDADLVPDYLSSLKPGGFYGWPYSYYGAHIDTRVNPQRPDLVAKRSSSITRCAPASRRWACCFRWQMRRLPHTRVAHSSANTTAGTARR